MFADVRKEAGTLGIAATVERKKQIAKDTGRKTNPKSRHFGCSPLEDFGENLNGFRCPERTLSRGHDTLDGEPARFARRDVNLGGQLLRFARRAIDSDRLCFPALWQREKNFAAHSLTEGIVHKDF